MSLNEVTIEKARDLILDREAIQIIESKREPVFIITGRSLASTTDELVDLEVTLRKGKRVGLFSNA